MNSLFPIANATALAAYSTPLNGDGVFWQLLAVLLLVVLNGFFVACEFAMVKVRAAQFEEGDMAGRKRARMARQILGNVEAYLSTAQLGITLTSLGLGWAGGPFVARLLAPVFRAVGLQNADVIGGLSFLAAFSLISFLHIVVGEQAPKVLALRRARQILLLCGWPIHVFYTVFRPFIRVINISSGWVLRHILRVGNEPGSESVQAAEELRAMLETSAEGEGASVSALGREILINALDMRKRVVRDIMTPRGEVAFLDLEDEFDENVRAAQQSRHTRFPLCRGHLDDTVGLIHIKDLLALVKEDKTDLLSIKREMVHVPEMMPLERLLKFFLTKHAHLALVVDEYGGAVGVVTLDNVLAELVGEIQDEFDQEEEEYRKLGEGEFVLEGGLALHDLEDLLGLKIESAEVSTIGGFLTHRLGHLPRKGERIVFGGYDFTVSQTDGRRVVSVHAKRRPDADAGDDSDD